MTVHSYYSASGRDLIREYIDGLQIDEQVDAYSVLQCMENNEWDKLYYKPWQDKIWEVYFYKANRIFYVVADKENVYLLHACQKQKNRTEKKDKDKVIKRAKELGLALDIRIVR